MVPVPARDQELLLDISRCKQLAGHDALHDVWHKPLDDPERRSFELGLRGIAPATLERIRRVLNDSGHDVFPRRCQAWIAEARESDLDDGLRRALTVFGRIERTLDVMFVRRDHKPIAVLWPRQALNFGQAVESEMQLGSITTGTVVTDAARKSGLHMPCPDEAHERALRIGIGDDHVAVETLARFRLYAGHAAVLDNDARDRYAGSNRGACLCRRIGNCVAHRAHSAFGGVYPTAVAGEAVEISEQRIGRTRPEMSTEDRVETHQAPQGRVSKSFGYFVMNVHAYEAQELTHIRFTQPANVEPEPRQRQKVPRSVRDEPWRRPVQMCLEQVRITHHLLMECRVAFRIAVTYAVCNATRYAQVFAGLSQRNGCHVFGSKIDIQLQIFFYCGLQLVEKMRTG